jgi:hypothetical protein
MALSKTNNSNSKEISKESEAARSKMPDFYFKSGENGEKYAHLEDSPSRYSPKKHEFSPSQEDAKAQFMAMRQSRSQKRRNSRNQPSPAHGSYTASSLNTFSNETNNNLQDETSPLTELEEDFNIS